METMERMKFIFTGIGVLLAAGLAVMTTGAIL